MTPRKHKGTRRLGRLVRFIIMSAGILFIAGLADMFITQRALQGHWQFEAPTLSEASVDQILKNIERRREAKKDSTVKRPGPPGRRTRKGPLAERIPKEFKRGLATLSNKLMGAVASHSRLELQDGGYVLDGPLSTAAGALLYQERQGNFKSCMTGRYFAAFPIAHVECGDGSGRAMWFLMKTWPGERLELFPLPIGQGDLQKRTKELIGDREQTPEARQAAMELLTLRFIRIEP